MSGSRRYVIDTSALLEIRRIGASDSEQQKTIFPALTKLVEEHRLLFPLQVRDELRHGNKPLADKGLPDPVHEWVEATWQRAATVRDEVLWAGPLPKVLARCPLLVDAEKTSGADEADPYVVALACYLVDQAKGSSLAIVSEDRKDRARKMSVFSSAGVMGVPAMRMRMMLYQEGIHSPPAWRSDSDGG